MSYLDLESPSGTDVLCLVDWPLLRHRITWSQPQEWVATFFDAGGPEEWAQAHKNQCSTASLAVQQCADIVIPVSQMKRPLALAMGHSLERGWDVLGAWAKFFLLLTFAIWSGVTTHDLALIGRRKKHFILDVTGINNHCPKIRIFWRAMAGGIILKRLVTQENLRLRMVGIGIAALLAPAILVWNLLLFNFFIVPLLMLAFVRYPIRMSRAWVFISCLACGLYGIVLAVQQLVFIADSSYRPRYAVTWTPDEPLKLLSGAGSGPVSCTCGCDYPVSFNVLVNLLIIGVLTTIKSAFLAFRCLKGLRRSQWANLLSVMFPVPITMYSVDWQLPSGQPIRFRTEGVPVQGEIAFDPFAMMDEQLDSAATTIHLKPEPVHVYSYNDASGQLDLVEPHRHLEMPALPMPAFREDELQVRKVEYIGCCGFPWPTGGQQYVYDPDFVAALEEGAEATSLGSRPSTCKTKLVDEPDDLTVPSEYCSPKQVNLRRSRVDSVSEVDSEADGLTRTEQQQLEQTETVYLKASGHSSSSSSSAVSHGGTTNSAPPATAARRTATAPPSPAAAAVAEEASPRDGGVALKKSTDRGEEPHDAKATFRAKKKKALGVGSSQSCPVAQLSPIVLSAKRLAHGFA